MSFRHVLGRGTVAIMAALLLPNAGAVAAEEGLAAKPAEKKAKTYRYGVGWDEGLAFRARLGDGWGIGLRVNPDFVDPEVTSSSLYDNSNEYPCYRTGQSTLACRSKSHRESESTTTRDQRTFSGTLMLYHERNLGKWLAAGPYLGVGYERASESGTSHTVSHDESSDEYPWTPRPVSSEGDGVVDSTFRSWRRSYIVELGLRPVFRFHERFTLETRFGVELRFTNWNSTNLQHDDWTSDGSNGIVPLETPFSSVQANRGSGDSEYHNKGSEHRFRAVGERLGPGAELRFVVYF